MTKEEIYEKLESLIVEKLEVDKSQITMGARFREDLGADSLDTYDLLYAIQLELGIHIEDSKAASFETVEDAYNHILKVKGL